MRAFIEALCSPACRGREVASPGSTEARRLITEALTEAGLTATFQPIPGCAGTNVLAEVKGTTDRWVVVGAHYDHLGQRDGDTYYGADDNAAAVAIAVELGRALKAKPLQGRNVLLAFFDAEEPPHFMKGTMGSAHFVAHPTVPFDTIDFMVCMDLVGHAIGPAEAPASLRNTLFALGAERSPGTRGLVDRLAERIPGVVVRRADAEAIPPLSDYHAFWKRQVPFLFLSCGRWEHYHQPTDTPEKLDYEKIAATAKWVEAFVRATCSRPEPQLYLVEARDDRSTLMSLMEVLEPLSGDSTAAAEHASIADKLLAHCDIHGLLAAPHRPALQKLTVQLETMLASPQEAAT